MNLIGYENLYKIYEDGTIIGCKLNKALKPNKLKRGYLQVKLYKNKVKQQKLVHVLVAEHFIPNPLGKPQVNHIDGNKENNHKNNLEWVTAKENMQHAFVTLGRKSSMQGIKGKDNHKSIPVICYNKQGSIVAEYVSAKEAEDITSVLRTSISSVCKGKRKSAGGFIWKYK